ncbi:hypothetical protein VSQ48_09260 [Candidatus Ventrimonas sp. KK005]
MGYAPRRCSATTSGREWKNPDRNERTKRSETPPKTGAGTTAEGTGKMNTKTIPEHNNFRGHSLPCP